MDYTQGEREPGVSFASQPDAKHDITLCFDAVSLTRSKRLLLDKVTGIVRGGRLTALVSACGGRGDYHLLSVLAAQVEPSSGLVIANGTLVNTDQYRRHCALIDEEMTVLDKLTVQQNLLYGSEMRVESPAADHAARLDTVVEWMKLTNHLSRQVLACSQYVRRRVSIARELMLHPAAVFVDSAIEGLATHEARELMGLLRHVASCTGAIIVVSMLQPRWTLLELTDDTIVLENATVVYVGPSPGLVEVAAAATLPPRPLHSPGRDHNGSPLQRPVAAAVTAADAPETCLNAFYRVASNPNATIAGTVPLAGRLDETYAQVNQIVARFSNGELPTLHIPFPRTAPWKLWKFVCLCKYGIIQVWNRILLHALGAALLLLAAVLIGVVYERQGTGRQAGMQNRVGIIFFLISSTFLHNLLFVESTRRSYLSFKRHRAHGYFDCVTYLSYWVFTNALQRLAGSIAFMVVVYLLAHVRSEVDLTSLQNLVAIMASTSFATSAVVWLVCCIVPTVRLAHYALFSIYAFNTILAGIVLNVNTLPKAFQEASRASLIRLGYESAVISEFRGNTFGCDDSGNQTTATPRPGNATDVASVEDILAELRGMSLGNGTTTTTTPAPTSAHLCFTGDTYMSFLGFNTDREWANMALMGYITAGIILLSLLAMWLGKAR